MAETNERITKLEELANIMQDNLIVMAHLEKRQGEMLLSHANFIEKHETMMHEFDGKMNALINIVARRQGGMEAQSNPQS
jgi:hypothetical protein